MRYFLLIFAVVVVTVVVLAGWRGDVSQRPPIELFADMVRQPKVRPQTRNDFFPDQLSSQLAAPGTVARSAPIRTGSRLVYPFQDSPVNTGRVAGGTHFVETNPLPVTAELLRRGQQRFDIHCAACHTRLGDGNPVAKRIAAMPVVANLHDKRIVVMPDGEIFNTITSGKNLMSGYGPDISVENRWAIMAYLRALQLSWLGAIEDLPEAARSTLKQ